MPLGDRCPAQATDAISDHLAIPLDLVHCRESPRDVRANGTASKVVRSRTLVDRSVEG
jgi:hypothetical protein